MSAFSSYTPTSNRQTVMRNQSLFPTPVRIRKLGLPWLENQRSHLNGSDTGDTAPQTGVSIKRSIKNRIFL